MRGRGASLPSLALAGLIIAGGPVRALEGPEPVEVSASAGGLPALDRLTATRDRPLFSPTRRPPPVDPPAAPEEVQPPPVAISEPPPPPPDLRLVGIVGVGSTMTAVFADPATSRLQRLRPGEAVLGWTLSVTSPKSVAFERADERVVQTLFQR